MKKHMNKKKTILAVISLLLLLALTLSACGKSEFGVSENTDKRMTVTAKNADKNSFFMVGSLHASEGEEITITSNLAKGSVKIEIIGTPAEQSIEELPKMDGEAIITANATGTDVVSGTVPAGQYMLKATCTERATGTVQIEVKPAA
ncbi:MAG: hypothetical protein IJ237_02890 [Oscillospiraceae bacterium]|nr:hypothetical protein [Oscillospiraceae bacterium]